MCLRGPSNHDHRDGEMRTNAGAIPAQTVSLPFVFVWFWVWFRCAFCEGLGFEFEFVFFPGSGCTSDARNLFNLVHPIEKRALRILENWVVRQAVTCLCQRQCPKVVSLTSVLFFWRRIARQAFFATCFLARVWERAAGKNGLCASP